MLLRPCFLPLPGERKPGGGWPIAILAQATETS